MPTKRIIALIIFFWLLTTGFVAYRDLLPRLLASSQPTIAIDLADEAAHNIDVRWGIYRDEELIGRLTTELKYNKEDDTFDFTCDYKDLVLEVGSFTFFIPVLQTKDTITRGGDLRKQMAKGEVDGRTFGFNGKIKASVRGKVIEGQLLSECDIETPLSNLKEVLDPVPVTTGLPLMNPLQPLNRLSRVIPGDSWFVQMRDPLKDAILKTMFKSLEQFELFKTLRKTGFGLPDSKRERLVAVVLPDLQELNWHLGMETCWVIEYRHDVPVARTWVRVSDGRVLEQEVFFNGEHLKIVRDN